MYSWQMQLLGLCHEDMWHTAILDMKSVFSASQIHRFYTSKAQAMWPPFHVLTSLMITPKDYQLLYVF